MDKLFEYYQRRLQNVEMTYIRNLENTISWDARLIGIKGARGCGKTTLLLQHINKTFENNLSKALFTTNGLPLDVKVKKTKETSNKYIGTLIHGRIPKGNVLTINKTTGEMSLVYKLKGPFAPQLICKGLPIAPNTYSGSIVTNDVNAVNVGTFTLLLFNK